MKKTVEKIGRQTINQQGEERTIQSCPATC
jgi:hypothetical protein